MRYVKMRSIDVGREVIRVFDGWTGEESDRRYFLPDHFLAQRGITHQGVRHGIIHVLGHRWRIIERDPAMAGFVVVNASSWRRIPAWLICMGIRLGLTFWVWRVNLRRALNETCQIWGGP